MTSLAGRTVLVTRAAEDAEPWVHRIRELGGEPVAFPCLGFRDIADDETRRRLQEAVGATDWIVFTSARGVEASARLLGRLPLAVHVAVVGFATERAARRLFGRADLVGEGRGAEGLAHQLVSLVLKGERRARETRVLVAAADRAGTDLEAVLEPLGMSVCRIAVYHTVPLGPEAPGIDLRATGVDVVLLASPSAVEGLVSRTEIPPDTLVITIGPTTSRAARAAGLTVAGEAERPDLDALLEAIP